MCGKITLCYEPEILVQDVEEFFSQFGDVSGAIQCK